MSATSDLIQKIYIGYFGRAGDPSGLNYWVEQSAAGLSDAAIAQSFSVQPEATDMYGFLAAPSLNMGRVEFLNSVYQNLFGRDMDDEGEEYWIGQLDAGRPVGGIILDIINGAQNSDEGQDLTVITNKLAVANYYTEKVIAENATWTLEDDQQDAIDVLSEVDATAASVTAAEDLADELVAADTAPAGQTFTLTTSANSFTGGAGADTFDAYDLDEVSNTLGSNDALDGAGGTDTLDVYLPVAASNLTPSLTAIENVNVTADDTATLNMSQSTGYTTLAGVNSSAELTFSNISSTSVGLALRDQVGSGTNDVIFGFTSAAVAGSADSVTLTLDNVTEGSAVQGVTIAGVETVNIVSTGSANDADLTTAAATRYVVTGSQDLDLNTVDGNVTSIDASALAAGLTADVGAGAATVSGGTGNDSFIFGVAGNVSVTGGNGNDTFDFQSGAATTLTSNDTVSGGEGTDTLRVDVDEVDSVAITTAWTRVSSIETLNIAGTTGGDDIVNVANIASSINRVNLSTTTNSDGATINFAAGSSTVGINHAVAITAGDTLTIDAAGSATTDSLAITNMLTTGNIGSATSALTITDYETVSLNTGSYSTPAGQNLGALSAGSAAITITGSNSLTLAAGLVASSLDASGLTGTATLTMSGAATSIASITGSAGNDTLVGDSASNINGGAGADAITGGSGADTVTGGDGNDTVTGAAGNDNINLGANDDRLVIASGELTANDTVVGGDGTDTMVYSALLAADDDAEIVGAITGIEVLEINAAASRTLTLTNFAASTITRLDVDQLAAGTLTVENATSSFAELRLLDDATGDTVTIDRLADVSTNSLTISARGNLGGVNAVTGVTVSDEETLYVSGSNAANDLTITTLTAADLKDLYITGAADVVVTNAIGSASSLRAVDASGSTGAVSINGTNSTVDITATAGTGVFTFTGGTGDDTITGGVSSDVLTGGSGRDSITGNNGDDYIAGGAGKDTITLTEATAAVDEVELSVGATTYDVIYGFSAGGGTYTDNLSALDSTFAWFGDGAANTDGTVALVSAASLKAAKAADDDHTVATISTNVAAGTFADFIAGTITEAEMEALVIDGLGLTGAMVATDIIMVLIDDGTNTGVFKFTGGDAGTDDAVDASEIEIMTVLMGVSNATTVVAGDILFA